MVKYIVRLNTEEREQLLAFVNTGRAAAAKLLHARILLKANVGAGDCQGTDEEIAGALDTSAATVHRVRQTCADQGMEVALARKRPTGLQYRKLDGAQEAQLIAVAWSVPPGRQCAVDPEVRGLSDQRRLAPLDRCTSVRAPPSTRGFPCVNQITPTSRKPPSRNAATCRSTIGAGDPDPFHAKRRARSANNSPKDGSRCSAVHQPSQSSRPRRSKAPRSGSVLSWSVRPAGRMACVVRMSSCRHLKRPRPAVPIAPVHDTRGSVIPTATNVRRS